jgi:hypothetical protein
MIEQHLSLGVFILFFLSSQIQTSVDQVVLLYCPDYFTSDDPPLLFYGSPVRVHEEKQLREMLIKRLGSEQTDTLMFLSLNLKKTLVKALDSLSTIIPTTRAKEVRQNLETLYQDLKILYRTSGDLEKAIDQENKD